MRVSAGAAVPHDRISAQGLSSDEIELSAGHGNKKCGHWGIGRKRQGSGGAAVVGLIMFALAGMGLFAIFNAIQGATESSRGTTTASTALQAMLGGAVEGEKIDLAEARGEGDDMASSRWIEKRSPGTARREVHRPNAGLHKVSSGDREESATGVDGRPKEGRSNLRSQGGAGPRNAERKENAAAEAVGSHGGGGGRKMTSRPNVFFIMIDDMGWNDIGYQSTDLYQLTPNLDKLASDGIKMTNYYTMSICTPARASLMTGRYPLRYGLQYNVIQPGAPWGLPLQEKILPQYLNDHGFISHMVGKWHLGSYKNDHTPHRRGFDTYFGYLNDEERYWTHQSWTATLNGNLFFDFGFGNQTDYYDIIQRDAASPTAGNGSESITTSSSSSTSCTTCAGDYVGKYSTTLFTDRAVEIIEGKTPFDEEPLFLYLAHQAVHDPLGLPAADSFTEEEWAILDSIRPTDPVRKKFAKVLFYLDKTIGDLVATLEAGGWMENSIIVVASDNGGCPTNGGSNYPLRGIKHSYWEGGNKVPSFVYSKSHIPEQLWGTNYNGLMHVTDWAPTILGAIDGVMTGMAGELDGVNHWDYMMRTTPDKKNMSPRRELLYNFDPYILWSDSDAIGIPEEPLAQGAFRSGKWKFLFNVWCTGWYTFDTATEEEDPLTNHDLTCQDMGTCSTCGQACLSTDNYTDWLFDLEADPREEHNLIHEFPQLAHAMRNRAREIAFHEWTNSSYQDIDTDAYKVWAANGWWMLPWYGLVDEFVDDSSTSVDYDSSVKSSTNQSLVDKFRDRATYEAAYHAGGSLHEKQDAL